jgi:hypothetical protein
MTPIVPQIVPPVTAGEARFIRSWDWAVERWLRGPESDGWIGSNYNMLRMVEKIDAMGLADALDEDKCAALTAAFQALLAENALQPFGYLN